MRVPNSSSDAVATMEIARTGNYGNDMSEEKLFHECAGCGDDIYYGDEYYEIDDKIVCEDCIGEYLYEVYAPEHRKVAEYDNEY